jgi:hypothetical protein
MTIGVATPFTIESSIQVAQGIASAMLTSTKAIVIYDLPGEKVKVVIVESDESVGTPLEISTGSVNSRTFIVALSSTKALAVWVTGGGGDVRFRSLTISGTTITSPGSILTPSFTVDSGFRAYALVNLTSTNSLFVYTTSSVTKAVIMSVSGDTVTEESGGAISAWGAGNWDIIALAALSSTKVIACYDETASSNRGVATILNISGVNVSDGGVDTVFEAGHTNGISVINLSATAAIVTYSDAGDSNKGKAEIITVSGSTPTANTPLEYEAGAVSTTAVAAFDTSMAAVASEGSGSDNVIQLSIDGTTITKGNEESVSMATETIWMITFDSETILLTFGGSVKGAIVTLDTSTHLWLSTDGGATYTNIGDNVWGANVAGGVVVVPGTAYQTIFAAVGTSLYKTTNGGTAWTLETAIGYEVDFIDLEKDNTTVFLAKRDAAGTNRASLWDSVGASLSHINTGKSTTGGATSGGDVV